MAMNKEDVSICGSLANPYLQPACYQCAFTGFPRWGDITLADYWGVEGRHLEFSDNKGTSLMFTNTSKGSGFFNEIKDQLTVASGSKE